MGKERGSDSGAKAPTATEEQPRTIFTVRSSVIRSVPAVTVNPDKSRVAGARALGELAEALGRDGLAVELERWPAPYKGIDDALAAGAATALVYLEARRYQALRPCEAQ